MACEQTPSCYEKVEKEILAYLNDKIIWTSDEDDDRDILEAIDEYDGLTYGTCSSTIKDNICQIIESCGRDIKKAIVNIVAALPNEPPRMLKPKYHKDAENNFCELLENIGFKPYQKPVSKKGCVWKRLSGGKYSKRRKSRRSRRKSKRRKVRRRKSRRKSKRRKSKNN